MSELAGKALGRGPGFLRSIAICLRHYAGFRGRAARSEFWYWLLAIMLIGLAIGLCANPINRAFGAGAVNTLNGLMYLLVFLPTCAVNVRRLHDLDRSGWWSLVNFIPLAGGIVMMVWFRSQGTPGPNRFGPDPLAAY